MILVYAENTSNRLRYTLNVIFNCVLKIDYSLVDLETFNKDDVSAKINYSSTSIKGSISIVPNGLLEEVTIQEQKLTVEWENGVPFFFRTSNGNVFEYDLFAATFYMVSRYEEYLPHQQDEHGRFTAEESFAFKNNFLELPVVNLWAMELKKEILKHYPLINFPEQHYQFTNTLDIDVAFAYKGKSFLRLMSSTLKSLLTFNVADVKNRVNYFIKKQKDPYDVYKSIQLLKEQYQTKNIYFFLLGDYGAFDKNLPATSPVYQSLIKKIAKKNQVGIHPSYRSNTSIEQVKVEKDRLKTITNQEVVKSRQHFLKLNFPATYEGLILVGIQQDYSMGFAGEIGFRAGVCSTYPFFNVLKNEERELLITPFQLMDGTLKDYLNLSPEEAIEKIRKMIDQVKNVNGSFVAVWHNSSLGECTGWENWSVVYESLMELATDKK